MSRENLLTAYRPILYHYAIEPHFIEEFGHVKKIYSNKGVFALKNISPQVGIDFVREVQTLFQQGYNRVVPIYPTTDGRYGVLYEQRLYYLMPWVVNEVQGSRSRHEQLFRELARLHTLSAEDVTVTSEERTTHYEETSAYWEQQGQFLEEYIAHCEAKSYMSPFELLFCLYFNDMKEALNYATKKFTEWHEKTKEQQKVRTVITHGKVSPAHFLINELDDGYFINFERAKRTSPVNDLLPFIAKQSEGLPRQNDELIESLFTYFKYFPLTEEEKLLFSSYLAHPGQLIEVAEKYYVTKTKQSEVKYVRNLQRSYWYMKNVEYIVMKIEEVEQQNKLAGEAQQEM